MVFLASSLSAEMNLYVPCVKILFSSVINTVYSNNLTACTGNSDFQARDLFISQLCSFNMNGYDKSRQFRIHSYLLSVIRVCVCPLRPYYRAQPIMNLLGFHFIFSHGYFRWLGHRETLEPGGSCKRDVH